MRAGNIFYFCLAFVVLVIDQATKYLITKNMNLYQVTNVIPCFNVVYYRNIGSAFGMFKGLGNPIFILISTAAILAVSVMIIKDGSNRLGFSLILGGAAGNLFDRVARGYVVDFLEFYARTFYWPAFNVADAALTVGIGLLILESLRPWPFGKGQS